MSTYIRHTIQPLRSFSVCSKEAYIHAEACAQTFIEAFFVITQTWKQLKCPLIGECINKWLYTHTIKYHSALKKKWSTDIYDINKSQNSHAEYTYYMIPLTYNSRRWNLISNDSEQSSRGSGEEGWDAGDQRGTRKVRGDASCTISSVGMVCGCVPVKHIVLHTLKGKFTVCQLCIDKAIKIY